MKAAVVSCAMAPGKTLGLAELALAELGKLGVEADLIDLAKLTLPLGGAPGCWEDAAVKDLTARLKAAQAFLIATPVYNYDANAAAKNLMELTGSAWDDKVVGFLCAAGGQGSYMSILSYANSLMLDYRCIIVPRFVYATTESWEGQVLKDEKMKARITELAKEVTRITGALSK